MPEYRRGAHTVFEIHLHLVWITKYRRPALSGEVATRVRDLIRDTLACVPHLRATRGEDYEGTRGQGPRASVCVDPAASDDQPAVAVVEREDGASSAGRVSAFEE